MIKHDFGTYPWRSALKTAGWILFMIGFGISVGVVGALALIFLIWVV